jgi:hypothetical protein
MRWNGEKKTSKRFARNIDLVKNFGGLFFRIIRIIFCVRLTNVLYRSELGFFKQEKEEYIFVFVVIFYVFEKGVFLDLLCF